VYQDTQCTNVVSVILFFISWAAVTHEFGTGREV
jgi:hypothetical protein